MPQHWHLKSYVDKSGQYSSRYSQAGDDEMIRRLLKRIATTVLIILIRGYQCALAPLFIGGCRHQPTCSEYAIAALQKHGLGKGIQLAAGRLWRCRPRGTFGYDPVP